MVPRVVGALLALRLAWGATYNGNRSCPKEQGSVLLQTDRQTLRMAQTQEGSQLQGLGRFAAYVNGSAPWPEDVNPVIDVDLEGRPIFHPAFLAASPTRTASNHLLYQGKSGQQWWYNQVTVKESSDVSYFSVNGHRFGYFGIQMVRRSPFHGRIVCSIWDQLCTGDNAAECPEEKRVEVLACGVGVTCTRFGGEGTGAKSQWEWNGWQVGKTYGFMTEIKAVGDDRMETSCWLHAEELGGWKLLSQMEVNRNGKPATIHGYYSFVEQWTSAGFGDAREATYGPTFTHTDAAASTPWSQILEATYTHGSHHTESTAHVHGYTASNVWGLASGADYEYTPTGTRLPRVIASSPPLPLTDFADMAASGSIPRGLPPSKAAASPIFLQPPDGMGCYGITRQAVLERRPRGENCEEFELDATGELVQSRASELCLELLGSDVVLKHCDPGREAQRWGGDGLTEFCNSGTCLQHTSTRVRLAHPSRGCYGGRPGSLLFEAGAEDSEDCPWFSYQGEENSNEFEVMLDKYCVDLFGGRGLGLYWCHGGSNQKLRRFDDRLCVGAHTHGNDNNCAKIIGFVSEAAVPVRTRITTSTSTMMGHTTTTTSSLAETTMTTTTRKGKGAKRRARRRARRKGRKGKGAN
eukprot:TRINITY_DN3510_c0_g1_i3.p1 TRINITY_DN3510_c0_g1~~TRINITY_DN3510_c0_g1_i3.p1  ORF type:complete len:637 (+),score=72.74 TRINITY_DN3510_c0_g1_i3:72-1982(+)